MVSETVNNGFPDVKHTVILQPDTWNDWYEWRTLFRAYIRDDAGVLFDIGAVKIAKIDHQYVNSSGGGTPLAETFSELDDSYVSVGQDESYYTNLRTFLGDDFMVALRSLQDLVAFRSRLVDVYEHPVVYRSLFRYVPVNAAQEAFARIVDGVGQASYNFTYARPTESPLPLSATAIRFSVVPGSTPPTNVHVLIGRNGSGKTTLLRSMARSMLGPQAVTPRDGWFVQGGNVQKPNIANLVFVGFSAFDDAELPVLDHPNAYAVPYSYVGLQYPEAGEPFPWNQDAAENFSQALVTRSPNALAEVFSRSVRTILRQKSMTLWRSVLQNLESDPNFERAGVSQLADWNGGDSPGADNPAVALYKKLSSGHKIVLHTVTKLVETVTERTLVILDEPEGHLHPPLLSAFIRTLSNLMHERNGVAIIATHSPVILQEVPRRCVWQITRAGDVQQATRPEMETFGENVGTLTNSVFTLEVSDSGFNKILTDAAMELGSYEAVVEKFGGELGFEARALLRGWFARETTR